MDPFHFACPHCSSRLRVREKLYLGRQVDCPECGDTLLIVDRAGELGVERVDRPPGEQTKPASKKANPAAGEPATAGTPIAGRASAAMSGPVPPPPNSLRRAFADRRRSLLVVGAAAALIAALVAVIHHPGSSGTTGGANGSPQIGPADGTTDVRGGQPTVQSPLMSPDETEPNQPRNGPPLVADAHERAGDPAISPEGDSLPGVDEGDNDQFGAENRPIEPQFAPEPVVPPVRKIDLAAALRQPIARFDQPRSKPLEDVLVSVAEMAGARIAYDRDDLGPAAARLGEPMALRLENTTVGEILSGLLRPAGLAYRIEGAQLRIVRAK